MFVCCQGLQPTTPTASSNTSDGTGTGADFFADERPVIVPPPVNRPDLLLFTPRSGAASVTHAIPNMFQQATGMLRLKSLSSFNTSSNNNDVSAIYSNGGGNTLRASKFQQTTVAIANSSGSPSQRSHPMSTMFSRLPIDGQITIGASPRNPWKRSEISLTEADTPQSLGEFHVPQDASGSAPSSESDKNGGNTVEEQKESLDSPAQSHESSVGVIPPTVPPPVTATPQEETVLPSGSTGGTDTEGATNVTVSAAAEEEGTLPPGNKSPVVPRLNVPGMVTQGTEAATEAEAKKAPGWRRFSGAGSENLQGSLSVPKSTSPRRQSFGGTSKSPATKKAPFGSAKQKSWAKPSAAGNLNGLSTRNQGKMAALLKPEERKEIFLVCSVLRTSILGDPEENAALLLRDEAALLWTFMYAIQLSVAGKQNPIGTTVTHLATNAEGELALKKAKEAAPKMRFWLKSICQPVLERVLAKAGGEGGSSPAPSDDDKTFVEEIQRTSNVLMGEKPPGMGARFCYLENVLSKWDWFKARHMAQHNNGEFKSLYKTVKNELDGCRSPTATVDEDVLRSVAESISSYEPSS